MRGTRLVLGATTGLSLAGGVAAQRRLFLSSALGSVSQVIGVTRIDIVYLHPAVKGRAIWGALVPNGQVWRLGANEATTIAFSDDVTVAGTPVAAGRYSLFAIPGQANWTFVLNRTADQWGAFRYRPAEDVARFGIKPEARTRSGCASPSGRQARRR